MLKDKPTTATDLAELGQIYAQLQRSLRQYLLRRVSDPHIAEDLLQEVFIKATLAIQAQRSPQNWVGWLYAAARTTVIDHYRQQGPQAIELDSELPLPEDDADELLHQQLATCLRPLLQHLPDIYRTTLMATDFDGASMKELAQAEGLSLSAIKSRASRARTLLKAQLLASCEVETKGTGWVSSQQLHAAQQCNECSPPAKSCRA